jgi:hypothetical protein
MSVRRIDPIVVEEGTSAYSLHRDAKGRGRGEGEGGGEGGEGKRALLLYEVVFGVRWTRCILKVLKVLKVARSDRPPI